MTHNLPGRIREHFADQSKAHLEKQVEKLCPVYRHIRDYGVVIPFLEAYGLESNSCMDCSGIDKTCKLFNDWYSKRHLRGIKFQT